MRSAVVLTAPVLAAIALAGCSQGDRVAYATPIPEARITSASELVGTHGVAGIQGVEFTSLRKGYAVAITQDRISVRDDCVTTGWSYRFDGAQLVTQPIEGPTCRRALTSEEQGLVTAFTGATKVSHTPVGGIMFEGSGGTVSLFQ
jgi:hypothetical protein